MPPLVESQIEAAINDGRCDDVKALLSSNPDMIRHDYGQGTWLHLAASRANLEITRMLLLLGCDATQYAVDRFYRSSLSVSVARGSEPITRLLLENGADPNVDHVIIAAIVGPKPNSLALVKLLTQHGADIHKEYMHESLGQMMNALSNAIAWGKKDVAEYLRSLGARLPAGFPDDLNNESSADEVLAYFKEHFGPPQAPSLTEIVPTEPSITVHAIPSAPDRPHVTLFTTGMSAHAMKLPTDDEQLKKYQHAEMFIQLPADWPILDSLSDPNHAWPIHWLRSMAQYPHQNDTWLGGPVTVVANGDPPEPLAPNTRFDAVMLMAERQIAAKDGRTIQLYRLTPLYPEERLLEAREGIGPLLRALDAAKTSFVVSLNRPNVGIEKGA